MKNQLNDIWDPIKANGVNYYMFAGPRTWFTPYSERSNPLSPYYQAWVGGYVIKQRDGYLPANLWTANLPAGLIHSGKSRLSSTALPPRTPGNLPKRPIPNQSMMKS
jgi:hypothetical protein